MTKLRFKNPSVSYMSAVAQFRTLPPEKIVGLEKIFRAKREPLAAVADRQRNSLDPRRRKRPGERR